jgi:hypothetical protein
MIARFLENREKIEKYMTLIGENPMPKTELDIIMKKKEIHLECIETPVYSKKYWEGINATSYGISCFLLDHKSELVECYHKNQVTIN